MHKPFDMKGYRDTRENGLPEELNATVHAAPLRALVVDDELSMVELVCCLLENLKMQVVRAHGSEEALIWLGQGRFDLLVTDLQMPDMNGYELAGWARSRSRDIKVMIMTGCPDIESYRNAVPSPVDCWMLKPFSFTEFRTALETLLETTFIDGSCPLP